MKKIGIITLCSNNNFGNKLQNYALLRELNKYSFDTSTFWVENAFPSNNIKALLKVFKNRFNEYKDFKRSHFFVRFTKEHLNINHKLIFNNDINKFRNKYDYFIVGSDQVWNYNFVGNKDIYFLENIDSKKCISYAASFGIEYIPKTLNDYYKQGLRHFTNISVREQKGKEIVEELTGRNDVEVVVDPTMLLTGKEWDSISIKPKQLDNIKEKKYILNYFLGKLSDSRKKEIEKVATDNNCYIINILDKNDPFYNCGPSEFLYLEKNAFLICTDSFHSSVFAILYNRPFVVFEREDKAEKMNSRIDTLLKKFKLENRRYNGKNITKENLKHDYIEAYKILELERKKSKTFLKKALDIK